MSVQHNLPPSVTKRPITASYRTGGTALDQERPVALVLGTGDIPSAIGRTLFLQGWGIVLLRDSTVPVLRRGMAFDDALETGAADLDGVAATAASGPETLPALAMAGDGVVVANLDLAVASASCPGLATVLIDARMRKYALQADLRPLAPCTVGIGPGFVASGNVHVAIETLPGQEGAVVTHGPTAIPTGKAEPLGGAGAERFVYASAAGAWQPHVPLGARISRGTTIGLLDGGQVLAPIDGCVRGLVRAAPGGVSRGSKLVEIDPRPESAWRGVPVRAQRIAIGVKTVLSALTPVGTEPVQLV